MVTGKCPVPEGRLEEKDVVVRENCKTNGAGTEGGTGRLLAREKPIAAEAELLNVTTSDVVDGLYSGSAWPRDRSR